METVEIDGQYRALKEEAGAVARERGFIRVSGADAAEYLQGQLTNDVEALAPGEGAYSALLDRKGKMQADMRLIRTADDVLVEVEPLALPAALRHLTMYSVGRDVTVEEASDRLTTISVVGPAAAELSGLGPLGREHDHVDSSIEGIGARVVRTDLGLDLIVAKDETNAVFEALSSRGVPRVDSEALEILRVETGRPRYGLDMTTESIPQEAGINDRAVSFTKGCYIGQETVARLHYKGKPNRHLRGLRLAEMVAPGTPVRLGERELGTVGTAVLSPSLGPIALAILRREAEPGASVEVGEGGEAQVCELPF